MVVVGDKAVTEVGSIDLIEQALIRVMRRANHPRSHDAFVARAGIAIEKAGYVLLVRIGEAGSMRLSELADVAGVDPSTASRQVKGLIDRGFVTRIPDPVDGRAALLALTPGGAAALDMLRRARHERFEEMLAEWSDRDLATLGRLLDRLATAFEQEL